MKHIKLISAIMLFIAVFTGLVSAEGEKDSLYKEQYETAGADSLSEALPDDTRRYFEENGIDPADYGWVSVITADNVFSHIWGFLKSGAKAPLKAGAEVTALILIAAALSAAQLKGGSINAALYVAAAAAAGVIAVPVLSSVSAAANALKGISTFMLSFIPVFAVITAASGAAATSVSMSALLLTAAQGVSYISSFVIMPLMGGYMAVSISGSVSPLLKKSGIAVMIKRLALWITAFVSAVFVGILSIQTAVNASADTLSAKAAKFIIGSSVPVAGGVLSEALGTVTASMGLLKSSVGIYGAVACAGVILPLIAELLVWRAVLFVTAAVSELFSLNVIAEILRAADSVISTLIGIMLIAGAMFIISLAIVVTAGKTQ
ncbi:MAG TPA: hypothetical protein DEQ65_06555 [Ruminococcaceae bacterium]|nr:hypothetical protein [Oscillospiraceae bacterium]